MRLHIAQNEKIISRCIDNFEEVFPNDNKWVILPNGSGRDYIGDKKNVWKCDYDTDDFKGTVGKVESYEKIIVHFLTPQSASFVQGITHPEIYWIEWGADLYNGLLYPKGFELYESEKIPRKYARYKWLGPLYGTTHKYKLRKTRNFYLSVAKKMKYFVPDSMYDEYPLLLKYYPELKHLQYREFFYYPINEVLGEGYEKKYSKGNNIIIGNSASLSGNHYEALDLLSLLNIDGRKVIVPISYGLEAYGKDVVNYGKRKMGDKIYALKEYLTLDKYNEILESANIFIYNNYRQEAVGNILVALYLGGKVFLNKKNPLLPFYKRLGLAIFELEELRRENGFNPLGKEEIGRNREILIKQYSRERQLLLIKENM